MLETTHINLEKVGGGALVCQSNKIPVSYMDFSKVFVDWNPGVEFPILCCIAVPSHKSCLHRKWEKCGFLTESNSKAALPSNRLAGLGFTLQDADTGS